MLQKSKTVRIIGLTGVNVFNYPQTPLPQICCYMYYTAGLRLFSNVIERLQHKIIDVKWHITIAFGALPIICVTAHKFVARLVFRKLAAWCHAYTLTARLRCKLLKLFLISFLGVFRATRAPRTTENRFSKQSLAKTMTFMTQSKAMTLPKIRSSSNCAGAAATYRKTPPIGISCVQPIEVVVVVVVVVKLWPNSCAAIKRYVTFLW